MAKDKDPKPSRIKISPWWIYGGILGIFLIASYFNNSNWQEPIQTNISQFQKYLDNGDVNKVIIVNKTQADVYLKPSALEKPEFSKIPKKNLF